MKRDKKIFKNNRKKKFGLLIFLMILSISIISIIITDADFFSISNIIVKGNSVLDKESIITASGISKGDNLFKISIKNIKKNLRLIPYIKTVQIKRKLPKTLLISVKEREENFAIYYLGSYIYIDDEGRVLNVLINKKNKDIPIVKGLQISDVNIGEILSLKESITIKDILKLINVSKEEKVYNKILFISVDSNLNAIIQFNSGIDVAFGNLNDIKYKMRLINEILSDIEKKGYETGTIYLNRGNNAVYER